MVKNKSTKIENYFFHIFVFCIFYATIKEKQVWRMKKYFSYQIKKEVTVQNLITIETPDVSPDFFIRRKPTNSMSWLMSIPVRSYVTHLAAQQPCTKAIFF